MLFSDDQVAQFINNAFEPTWQAVRPVPIVRIDFGNGHEITRTLHGNIATYACTADGNVLDILPGIYEPHTYLERLMQFVMLHEWIRVKADQRDAILADYHRTQADALARGEAPHVINAALDGKDRGKALIEARLKFVLIPGKNDLAKTNDETPPTAVTSTEDLAGWKALADDTHINESLRRRMIHQHLADQGSAAPDAVTKWLYREVLHADLDDPYLGLGKVLFANYPFRAEDAQ